MASATPCADDRRMSPSNSPARGRSGSAGPLRPARCRARRCRCRALPTRVRPRPRPTPPTSRRPGYRRHRRGSPAATRVRATETKWPRCNWSCRRRSGRPAPPRRHGSEGSPRDNCGSASASGDGCARRSWFSNCRSFFPLPLWERVAPKATGEGSIAVLSESCEDVLQDDRRTLQHIIVPVARDLEALRDQDRVSRLWKQTKSRIKLRRGT